MEKVENVDVRVLFADNRFNGCTILLSRSFILPVPRIDSGIRHMGETRAKKIKIRIVLLFRPTFVPPFYYRMKCERIV